MKIKEATIRHIFEHVVPFNRFLGIEIRSLEPGKALLYLPFREEFIGDSTRPALHGGVISSLMDTAGGVAAWTSLEEQDRLSTVDILVDYLRPADRAALLAEGKLIRIGDRVAAVEIKVWQEGNEEPVASGRAVYNVVRRTKKES